MVDLKTGVLYHLYTTYSPCQLGDYMLPTTFYGNQKQPLTIFRWFFRSFAKKCGYRQCVSSFKSSIFPSFLNPQTIKSI